MSTIKYNRRYYFLICDIFATITYKRMFWFPINFSFELTPYWVNISHPKNIFLFNNERILIPTEKKNAFLFLPAVTALIHYLVMIVNYPYIVN
jgi:hypothetical protein